MKKIALINDLSGFGKCSLTAAIPVISVMGIQACPLPTAVLTAQTGFDEYYCDDYTDKMDLFTDSWKKMGVSFDGIYSGFLADAGQVDKVLRFLKEFQTEDTLVLVDPVLGDHGKTFKIFTDDLLSEMKLLVSKADVITPNLTELCLLTGESYADLICYREDADYVERIREVCRKYLALFRQNQTVIVTGILHKKDSKDYVGNLVTNAEDSFFVETPYTGTSFSGTGDLFASVVCGSLVKGLSVREAVEKAAYFLEEAIKDATEAGIESNHGVEFEKYLHRLM